MQWGPHWWHNNHARGHESHDRPKKGQRYWKKSIDIAVLATSEVKNHCIQYIAVLCGHFIPGSYTHKHPNTNMLIKQTCIYIYISYVTYVLVRVPNPGLKRTQHTAML